MAKRVTLAAIAVIASAGSIIAHDLDPLKLQELGNPVVAPILAGEDAIQRGGTLFPSRRVQLTAWLAPNNFPGGHATGASCWGYVSPSQREYAIMCLERGFGYVDITNPSSPAIVSTIMGPTSLWHDVKVLGRYAYGVSEGGWGIQVMDLDRIDQGIVTLVRNKQQNGHSSTHTIACNPDSGYLYLCGANISNGGLIAVDANGNRAADPVIVGSWTTRYVHECQVVSYTEGPYAGREIAFCCTGPAGIDVVDVTNKANMFRIGGLDYQHSLYCHQCWLSDDKKYLYVNDELDEFNQVVDVLTTRVFDVSNPATPTLVSIFSTGFQCSDHNLYLRGNLLFEADYKSGLRIFDLSEDRLSPTQVAWIDTAPDRSGTGFAGAWSNYPFFPSGTTIISDIQRGLFVVRLAPIWIDADPVPQPQPYSTTRVGALFKAHRGTLDAASATLHARINGGDFTDIPMVDEGGGRFAADLPAGSCLDIVEYSFSASNVAGESVTEPENGRLFSARVAHTAATVYANDFDVEANGFTVESQNVTAAPFALKRPSGGNQAAGAPTVDYNGEGKCFLTGKQPGEELDGGPTILTSPALTVPNGADTLTEATFAVWFTCDRADDALLVEVSGDDGATYTPIESISGTSGWELRRFFLEDHVTPIGPVRLRFTASDNPADSNTEAAIDAIRITSYTCGDCPADFNADGILNVFDFLDFQTAFSDNDPRADLNRDGVYNVFDFLVFGNLFADGC